MIAEHARDAAMSAVILGFFASVWFGWVQEAPPPTWRRFLLAGVTVAGLTVCGGAVLAVRYWSDGTAFDEGTGRAFGIVVGIEVAAAGLGALLLTAIKRSPWIPVWVAFVVGLHLFPVAALLGHPAVHLVAAMTTLCAVASVPVARARSLAPSAVVGTGAGASLLAGALYSFVLSVLAH